MSVPRVQREGKTGGELLIEFDPDGRAGVEPGLHLQFAGSERILEEKDGSLAVLAVIFEVGVRE